MTHFLSCKDTKQLLSFTSLKSFLLFCICLVIKQSIAVIQLGWEVLFSVCFNDPHVLWGKNSGLRNVLERPHGKDNLCMLMKFVVNAFGHTKTDKEPLRRDSMLLAYEFFRFNPPSSHQRVLDSRGFPPSFP